MRETERLESGEWNRPDEQPIQRVVGKRVTPPPGRLPSAAARAAMTANARDRERWTVELIRARHAGRAGPHTNA